MKFFYLLIFLGTFLSSITNAQNTAWPSTTSIDNVGIGTTSPTGKLNVVANGYIGIQVNGNNATYAGSDINIVRSNSNPWVGASPTLQFTDLGTTYANIIQSFQGQLQFFNSTGNGWHESMRILGNGNVGLGVDAPISNFQVDDGCTKASLGDASGQFLNYGTSYLGFNAARNAQTGNWTVHGDGVHNGGGVVYSTILGDMYFAVVETNGLGAKNLSDSEIKDRIKLRISADGVTHAKQIKVETANWPDYVFKPAYHLKSLTAVKAYIDKNQHLPEMPSGQEVAKDGINIGEMNKLLVKKVEELTLYLIEKDTKDKQQQERIEALERKINKLIQLIDK